MSATQLEIEVLKEAPGVDLYFVRTTLERILIDHNNHRQLTCILTSDAHVHQLNRDFRGFDKSTDVLSFDLSDAIHPANPILGEIYISVDQAQRQAQEAGHTLHCEVLHLSVHGTLHLLGFEHDTDDGYQLMQTEEKRYLTHINNALSQKGV